MHETSFDIRRGELRMPPGTRRRRAGRGSPGRGASPGAALGMLAVMHLPEPRGPLSEALFANLTSGELAPGTIETAERIAPADALKDDDLQIALAACYELHYRGFDGLPGEWEWDPGLLRLRAVLERRHLEALRARTGPVPATD